VENCSWEAIKLKLEAPEAVLDWNNMTLSELGLELEYFIHSISHAIKILNFTSHTTSHDYVKVTQHESIVVLVQLFLLLLVQVYVVIRLSQISACREKIRKIPSREFTHSYPHQPPPGGYDETDHVPLHQA